MAVNPDGGAPGGTGAGAPAEPGEPRVGPEQPEKDDGQSVTVLLFASAREAAGIGRTRSHAGGRTVAELLDELVSTYGRDFEAVLTACAIWVNGSPATGSTPLAEGDEVAVLPPVSGGCGTLDFDVFERRRSL